MGTADFIVHHIHAFTIHVTLLILSKGVLYARNSRFVSDKLELGFTYPCDGPGRNIPLLLEDAIRCLGLCIDPKAHISLQPR